MGKKHKKFSVGFTLVELIVVIAVIAILATLATLGLNKYLSEGRDSERASSVATLSEALEKYYDKNGEYPSCSQLTAATGTVTNDTLVGMNVSALTAPRAAENTNSVTCDNIDSLTGDFFEYRGDGSATCRTGNNCLSFVLRYREESTGIIKEVTSRRAATIATSGAATLTANGTGLTQLTANWNPVSNATGYTIEISPTNTFSSIIATQTPASTSATFNSLSYNSSYFVRVRANTPTAQGSWSNIANASTLAISAPASVTVSPVNATGSSVSWSGVTNATGYTLQWSTNQTNWTDITTTNTTSAVTGLTGGTLHYYRVLARWNSNNSAPSPTVSRHTHPLAPTSVTTAAAMSGTNAVGTSNGTCAAGDIEFRQRTRNTDTSTAGTWSAWNTWDGNATRSESTSVGFQYGFQTEARCSLSSLLSGTVSSSVGTTVRQFGAPGAPTASIIGNGDTTTFARTDVSCPGTGTAAYQYLRSREGIGYTYSLSNAATISTTSSAQGYQYGMSWQARCTNLYSTGPWGPSSNTPTYIRPVNGPSGSSFNGYRGAWDIMYLTIANSCGEGALLHGMFDAHTWDWGWMPGNHIGWRRSSLGWVSGSGDAYWANNVTTGSQSSSGIPSGSRWNVGSDYRCQNSMTGRSSGNKVWQQSGEFYAS